MTLSAGARLGVVAVTAAAVFVAAFGVGRLTGPAGGADAEADARTGAADHGHPAEPERSDEAAHEEIVPAGLQVSADGYTLEVVDPQGFSFRILDTRGRPVTRFVPDHDKLMHLIVARRDLSGFRHVHPEMSADGTWRVPLPFAAAGDYRVFADFLPEGRSEGVTLGVDVPVPGAFQPVPLPASATATTVDGYRVTLRGHLEAGTTSKLTLSVERAGRPVSDLQPYLGAYGHLVALRQGDLAYLHVHPDDENAAPGPDITFYAEVPSVGTYRLYLDFKHDDVVRTAEITAVAESHEE
ncbi:hypothetical protein [Actinophytocola xanthii]|uniref:Heavy metal-binding domain-containing protein n=1 Tax=Actinophytocola xanthii TaxID=1912961 RepID=A0A1Q8CG87_9PSEU|nr:hypothetical protein [Actinophytocola xanthii]OLF13411.1 hypothetical protein BU204_27465 [Actinophytocola xanthii]